MNPIEYLNNTDGLVNCSEGSECISDDDEEIKATTAITQMDVQL